MRLSGQKPSPTTRRWTQRPRVVLLSLIGLNIAVFIAQLFLDAYQPGFVREYLALSDRGLRSAYGWQFLTAAFLHDGPWHLLGNMLLLYLLGRDVESIIGQRQFFFLYLTGTLAGELGHLFLMPESSALLAASGGPAAIVVAYAAILPLLQEAWGMTSAQAGLVQSGWHAGYVVSLFSAGLMTSTDIPSLP